ncbi:TOBE domain-containing protein [Hydrogenophaga sp. ZJX-1]|uniref:TOBE domain-containing protein n=1 Tax=Hydrogenophaga sp. ZJX-1 TaxID=3404778 RepID=UPI003B27B6FB
MTPLPPAALSEALGHAASDKRLEVLRCVGETGSISQAARDTGISYKAAWQAIDTLTNLSGVPLVERTVGGAGGGGARITAQGLQLLQLADELARARDTVLSRFAGGRSLGTGLGLRTSMRNQLPCRVERCEPASPDDPMMWVHLRTPGQALLTANLTRESADLLGLDAGLEVLVLCKATAVEMAEVPRASKVSRTVDAAELAISELKGTVERVSPGQGRDEVVLSLDGGGHWVGFAAHPFVVKPGRAAVARMARSALVVALPG